MIKNNKSTVQFAQNNSNIKVPSFQPQKTFETGLKIWLDIFGKVQETDKFTFMKQFVKFVKDNAENQLDEIQQDKIYSILEPLDTNIVTLSHFLYFYEKFWSIPSQRMVIFNHNFTPKAPQIDSMVNHLQLKILKAPQTIKLLQKNSIITVHRYYLRLVNEDIEQPLKNQDLCNIGTDESKCDIVIPWQSDIEPLNIMIGYSSEGFWIKDTAKTNRVKFMLQNDKSYMLCPGMLISFGLQNMFLVLNAYPYFNKRKNPAIIQGQPDQKQEKTKKNKYLDNDEDQDLPKNYDSNVPNEKCHYFNPSIQNFEKYLALYQKESQDPNYLQNKKNKYLNFNEDEEAQEKPILKLLGLQGKLKGKEIQLQQGTHTFGNSTANTYKIDDASVSKQQFKITYSNDNGWNISQQNQTLGTFLYLVGQQQYEANLPSKQHLIEDGMVFKFGDYIVQSNIIYNF